MEVMAGKQNPQDSHLFKLNETGKRKLFVMTIFTAPLPQVKKVKYDDDDSDWSPYKAPMNELLWKWRNKKGKSYDLSSGMF